MTIHDLIDSLGFKIDGRPVQGKHLKFRLRIGDVIRTYVHPVSGSDHRGMLNARATLRRLKREMLACQTS